METRGESVSNQETQTYFETFLGLTWNNKQLEGETELAEEKKEENRSASRDQGLHIAHETTDHVTTETLSCKCTTCIDQVGIAEVIEDGQINVIDTGHQDDNSDNWPCDRDMS